MDIFYITGNKSKFKEAKEIAKQINLIKKDLELNEPKTISQEEVVLDKARQAFKKIKKPVLTDDTAIYFKAYKNFPGTYTKFLFQAIGFKGVENLMKKTGRKACFQTLLCYKDKNKEKIFSGKWEGKITKNISRKFNPDWEYNSIFIPKGSDKFLSEFSIEERAKLSHRKKAFDKLIKFLKGGRK